MITVSNNNQTYNQFSLQVMSIKYFTQFLN